MQRICKGHNLLACHFKSVLDCINSCRVCPALQLLEWYVQFHRDVRIRRKILGVLSSRYSIAMECYHVVYLIFGQHPSDAAGSLFQLRLWQKRERTALQLWYIHRSATLLYPSLCNSGISIAQYPWWLPFTMQIKLLLHDLPVMNLPV